MKLPYFARINYSFLIEVWNSKLYFHYWSRSLIPLETFRDHHSILLFIMIRPFSFYIRVMMHQNVFLCLAYVRMCPYSSHVVTSDRIPFFKMNLKLSPYPHHKDRHANTHKYTVHICIWYITGYNRLHVGSREKNVIMLDKHKFILDPSPGESGKTNKTKQRPRTFS